MAKAVVSAIVQEALPSTQSVSSTVALWFMKIPAAIAGQQTVWLAVGAR